MKTKRIKPGQEISPFDRDLVRYLSEDPEIAEAYFEELAKAPAPLRGKMLRHLRGVLKGQAVKKALADSMAKMIRRRGKKKT